jgi:hypothetical protein
LARDTGLTVAIGTDFACCRRAMSVRAVYVAGAKQVVKVRMLPTEEQAAALGATLRTCHAVWLDGQTQSPLAK